MTPGISRGHPMKNFRFRVGISFLLLAISCGGASAQSPLTQPVTIPLRLVMAGASERLSIPVRIGDSGRTENYLFDTGSSPFIAAYTPGAPWWGSSFTPTGQSRVMHYVETGFQFNTVQSQISVGTGNQALMSSSSFPVDQAAVRYIKRGDSWLEDPRWRQLLQSAVQSGTPPEDGGHFYGTMGADLDNPAVGLYRLVSDAAAASGWRVTAGFALEGGLSNPHLTLGLTHAVKSRFPIQMPINRVGGQLAQKVITADFTLEYRGRVYPLGKAGVVLDTGAPRMGINTAEGFTVPPELLFGHLLRRGVAVHMTSGALSWTLVAGPGHRVGVRKASGPEGGVNAGIHFFESFNVLFDIKKGVIGFAPAH
jgi:hypothetical protein